ncbi:threonine-phosphate decarboxylase CobD [Anaerovorax odorimutans]|uniref:threonine-phosphate decarboxylase n=1 Tax=Anaerovorax odorimutans TaxID=109327 RepID=A0ABT1RN74_9FIRM|nr:threonine-phosphate decarboxylase CobD [Anaerovorax odorimutans]MCQ4636371.1 threonine-phosphate decarboxylase CobD [Anaerovorax odorimutans]
MTEFEHGGDIYTMMEKDGRRDRAILDFSANINPLGMPEGVKAAAAAALEKCDLYPDPRCRRLRRAVAEKEQVPEEYLIFGNGASDLIFRLAAAMRPGKVMVPAPTFTEYEKALRSSGSLVRYYQLKEEEDFVLNERLLASLDDSLDVLFLCNPNNPTGSLIPYELLRRIAQVCDEKQIFLVVDECFIDFVKEPQDCTARKLLDQYDNLFILRAFTKNYAMAGLRLGYGICGRPELTRALWETGQPWSVSLIAQEAGIQALREKDYLEKARSLIFKEREKLQRQLSQLGYKVYDPGANYIFFRLRQLSAPAYVDDFIADMESEGILIRSCANYRGLGKGYFRIAVRNEEENGRLVEALRRRETRWQKQL